MRQSVNKSGKTDSSVGIQSTQILNDESGSLACINPISLFEKCINIIQNVYDNMIKSN